MRELDIIPSDTIVIYDDFSLVGACRAWSLIIFWLILFCKIINILLYRWLLKLFGAEMVYILNGGLSA